MRRILWLLLALSLPAWATINAITSTRILTPCAEGQRDAAYPSGGACNPPAAVLYHQSFEALNTSQTFTSGANAYGVTPTVSLEAYAGLKYNANCNDSMSISTTVARETGGTQSLKFINNFALYSNSGTCPGTTKARVEYRMGANQAKLTTCSVDDCDSWDFGSERWIGFSTYWPTAGNASWGAGVVRPIFFQIIGTGAPTGDPESPILWFLLGPDGRLDVDTGFSAEAGDLTSAHDYIYAGGWVRKPDSTTLSAGEWAALKTSGSSGAEYHLKNIANGTASRIQRDEWTDFVVHFKKGYTAATGLIEVWMNGEKVVNIPAFPTTVNDFDESYTKSGMYASRNASGGTYTMYLDSYRATDETGSYEAVDPAQDD